MTITLAVNGTPVAYETIQFVTNRLSYTTMPSNVGPNPKPQVSGPQGFGIRVKTLDNAVLLEHVNDLVTVDVDMTSVGGVVFQIADLRLVLGSLPYWRFIYAEHEVDPVWIP